MSTRARWVLLGALFLGAALARWSLLERQGLWVDEVFSLAIATGHSLEHPAAAADPAQGDFVEGERPRSAREWGAYLAHEDPPAGPARVLRAALLSDTSPPLYYLLLAGWTRALGTGDAALRGFSLACALLCLPLFACLARWSGGQAAVLPSCALFALAPVSLYYGTEGRMYSLLWLCVLAFAWSTVLVRARPASRAALAAWIAAGAAGFLTHYFFAFVWGAVVLFALLRPGRRRRATFLLGAAATALLVLPWYMRLGQSLSSWRVTQGWLTWEPWGFARGQATLDLLLGFVSGADPNQWGEHRQARAVSLFLFALLLLVFLWRRRAAVFGGRRTLVWGWLAATLAGPLVFDALLGTYTVAVARYALAGLPAVLLLAGAAFASLGPWLRAGLFLAVLASWFPHLEMLYQKSSRSWCPLREVALSLHGKTPAGDLVLVHSIPSGVLGIARYSEPDTEIAAWVEQLGERRVPESLRELGRGRRMIHLVRVHEVGAPCPAEDWLRAHAEVAWEGKHENTKLVHFKTPVGGF